MSDNRHFPPEVLDLLTPEEREFYESPAWVAAADQSERLHAEIEQITSRSMAAHWAGDNAASREITGDLFDRLYACDHGELAMLAGQLAIDATRFQAAFRALVEARPYDEIDAIMGGSAWRHLGTGEPGSEPSA